MTSDERELKRLVARHLPSHMVFVAARDRVLNELRAAPPHLQKPRLADPPPAPSGERVEGTAVSWLRGALPAAAAALVIVAVGAAMVWPRDGIRVYAAGADGLQVTLADDSRVEMRAHSEMTVSPASDGIQINLKTGDIIVNAAKQTGDIIVNAAKQSGGHLYVRTKDMTVAVVGTVFFVNVGDDGSRVAVIEGEVHVQDGRVEAKLRPGEQMSTRPTPAAQVPAVIEQVAWSRRKDAYQALLQSAVATSPVKQQTFTALEAPPPPTTNRFEEASIRPCSPGDSLLAGQGRGAGANSSTLRMTPGRYYAECVTVGWMIYSSYPPDTPDRPNARPSGAVANMPNSMDGAVRSRLRGGPGWIYEDRYTIDAVADMGSSMVLMQHPMMWDLLERRMQLKVHVETDRVRASELTVSRGGLKIKPIADGETCVTDPPRTLLPSRPRNGEPSRCGISMKGGWVAGEGPNYRWEVSGTLSGLVTLLRGTQGPLMNGPPMLNKTGIDEREVFNFAVEFGPDDTTPAYLQRCSSERERFPRCAEPPTAPPLATVLERELGLKFQPTTEPREFVVIDFVERPSAN
jgi:uncharacterized protein (TIGR03435 family)